MNMFRQFTKNIGTKDIDNPHCGGCIRNCSLSSPKCKKGKNKADESKKNNHIGNCMAQVAPKRK